MSVTKTMNAARSFAQLLNGIKGFLRDDCFMGVFKHQPIFRWYFYVLFCVQNRLNEAGSYQDK
jgi:hypothetical protein